MSLDGVQLKLVNDLDSASELLRWLGEQRPIHALAIDLETTGLDRQNDRIKLAQIGDGMTGWAVPWEHWNGVIRDVVRRWDGDWITHNGPCFDLVFLRRYGVEVAQHRVRDTMVRAAVQEPHVSKGLKQQAGRHVDAAAGGLQEVLKGTAWTWENVPDTYGPYWQYGALDPVLTYRLEQVHGPVVDATCRDAYDLELAVQFVTERMERYGTHVDRAAAAAAYEKFTGFCAEVERWCVENYGVKPGSNQAVVRVLQEAGHAFSKATATGAVALDADVLAGVEHPLARQVLARRELQKMASTYLWHFLDYADADDLLHPSINTLGARTGRMSVSEPNLQNLPRLGTSGAGDFVRSMVTSRYVPTDLAEEAWRALVHGSLLMCDFNQIEMRLLAHFAREQAMIDAFRDTSQDFFATLAQQIYQDPTITKKHPLRQLTKSTGYAKVYGAGIRKLAQTAGVSEAQSREVFRRFDTLYPGVLRFTNETLNQAFERQKTEGLAYVRSPFTGRRFVADSRKEYALINYLIQGCAAEILKRKILELDAAGLGPWMFLPVHDEVLLDVPGEHVLEAANVLEKVMNDDTLLDVPVQAEVSYGRRWGQKQDWSTPEVLAA